MGKLILNGTAFNATEVSRKRPNYGTAWRSANGTPYLAKIGVKRSFTFNFDLISASEVAALETIANLNTTFAMVHPNGTTYTVQNTADGLEDTLAGEDSGPSGDWYTATLTLDEA